MLQQVADNILSTFIGTWKLIECSQIDTNGITKNIWGDDVLGYLIYTTAGIMAVQIVPKKQIPELAMSNNYYAYFGRFEINQTSKTVIHHVEADLDVTFIGKKRTRTYNFFDNKLSLITQGEATTKKLLWQKV